MDDEETKESIGFLFDISKEVKNFYETPVVFLTQVDYSDSIFNTMCLLRKFLKDIQGNQSKIVEEIVQFHLNWLQYVNEIDGFMKMVQDVSRETVYQATSFTIDAMGYRLKYYQRYMERSKSRLPNVEQAHVNAELEIVEEMHREVVKSLLDRLSCFRSYVSDFEFQTKLVDACDQLLHWLDKMFDGLSIQLSKYVNMNIPHLDDDLAKTLQHIVDRLESSDSSEAVGLIENLKSRGRQLSSMIRCTATRSLEISKVEEKITALDDRLARMKKEETTAAVMALRNKKQYLENRLESLENLKTNLKSFVENVDPKFEGGAEEDRCDCKDFYRFRIFNHSLPAEEREHLVSELCYLWDMAVFGDKSHKSIISILSAADVQEEFTDEIGTFVIDEYSRKIYKKTDDETRYQANEHNELVPVSDDQEHIYFYDECGRYYMENKTRQRVYKAHATASEYMMDSNGVLLKVMETRDGTTYYYDNYGRYYINDEGKHIYHDPDTMSEYEHDGLGNLVRIRSHSYILEPCPDDVYVTEEFKYLRQSVGQALRECLTDVGLHQPADPIKYLAAGLVKYRENIELKEKRSREKEELELERQYIREEERAAAERAAIEAALLQAKGGSEASYDSNFLNYTPSEGRFEDDAATGNSTNKTTI